MAGNPARLSAAQARVLELLARGGAEGVWFVKLDGPLKVTARKMVEAGWATASDRHLGTRLTITDAGKAAALEHLCLGDPLPITLEGGEPA